MKERFEGLNGYWFDINNIKSLEMSLNRVQLLSKDDLKKQMHVNRQRYLIEYQEDKIKEKYRNLIYSFV